MDVQLRRSKRSPIPNHSTSCINHRAAEMPKVSQTIPLEKVEKGWRPDHVIFWAQVYNFDSSSILDQLNRILKALIILIKSCCTQAGFSWAIEMLLSLRSWSHYNQRFSSKLTLKDEVERIGMRSIGKLADKMFAGFNPSIQL